MKPSWKAIPAALAVAAAPGCYRHGAALLGTAVGASILTAAIVSSRPPPAPRVVYVPPPRSGYVWQPGYWTRDHRQWVWVEGYWVRRHPGYQWQPSEWVQDPDGQWRLLPGQWVDAPPPPPDGPPGPWHRET
jgi:YXWGXW repeat-containing protein